LNASGWLLLAIETCRETAIEDVQAWSRLIGATDWINHAIVTDEELSTGLSALSALI
jgi:hypothetical protein